LPQDQARAGIAGLELEALNLLSTDAVPGASAITQSPATLFTESEFAHV
jgi:hypothetical protein